MTAIKAFLKTILYKPLYNLLIFLVWLIPGHSVGWAIIILTIIIRLILLPSTAQSIKAQKKIKDLQPEMDKIKEKYKGDQQAQTKALLTLYQQNKINPFSSCLPLLIQLPVLIILYYVFQSGLDTSRFADLLYSFTPRPETVNPQFFWINLARPDVYLAVLAGILQFWQTKQLTPTVDKSKNKGKDTQSAFQEALGKQMLYIMPFFTVIIALKLPAALPLYWSVTTIFMVIQQAYLLKQPVDKKGVSVIIRKPGL